MTPSQQVHEKTQLVFWWCGLLGLFIFFLGLWPMMQYIPPPAPGLTGEELVAKYTDNHLMVKGGIVLGILSGGMLIPLTIMIVIQISRLEYGRLPVLSITALCGGLGNAVFTMYPFTLWAGAWYRLDRDPELILLLNDTTWLEFVMLYPPFFLQLIATGAAILTSTAKQVVFPRWFGFFNLWTAVLMLPGGIAIYFYSGPFAWNGILAWWVVVVAFSIYWTITFYQFYKAIRSHKLDVATA